MVNINEKKKISQYKYYFQAHQTLTHSEGQGQGPVGPPVLQSQLVGSGHEIKKYLEYVDKIRVSIIVIIIIIPHKTFCEKK